MEERQADFLTDSFLAHCFIHFCSQMYNWKVLLLKNFVIGLFLRFLAKTEDFSENYVKAEVLTEFSDATAQKAIELPV